MNAFGYRRGRWRRLALRALGLVLFLAFTGTLAMALQVHEIRVSGAHHFPARDVELALQHALGTPTIAVRPETLRAAARTVPWVAEAQVRISLDGVVTCLVSERVPVAVGTDGGRRTLLDADGRVVGPANGDPRLLELFGFAPYPDDRAVLLSAVREVERLWGAALVRAEWMGGGSVLLRFSDTTAAVVADPTEAFGIRDARRVFDAWLRSPKAPPLLRLDARVVGRVAVLTALAPAVAQKEAS